MGSYSPASGFACFDGARFSAPPAVRVLRPRRSDGLGVMQVRLTHAMLRQGEIEVPAGRDHVLTVFRAAGTAPYDLRIAGQRHGFVPEPHLGVLVPAGADRRYAGGSKDDLVLRVHLPADWFARLTAELDRPEAPRQLAPMVDAGDPRLADLLRMLGAAQEGNEADRIFLDHWMVLVAHWMIRRAGLPPARNYALPPRRLAAVRAFVAVHLGREIALAELAAVAGLSVYHFARAFARETGQTPAAWLLRQRVAAAQRQLRDPSVSLAAVAEATGFRHEAALARGFQKVLGCSAAAWRRLHHG